LDLLKLDERLEKDITHLEKSLDEYEKLVNETSDLKYTLESQMKELKVAYDEEIKHLNAKYISDKELSSKSIESFNDYYKKVVTLFNDIELKKGVFELYINQMNQAYEEKWKDIQVKNENNLSDLDVKVNEKINKLEEENKRELMKIINSLTTNEKEIAPSKKEVAKFISEEVYKLLKNNNVLDEIMEKINTDTSKLKSELERSLMNLSEEFFKETMRADDKYKELAKNFKIFVAINSVLFIILLILILR